MQFVLSRKTATGAGLMAVVLWGTVVGLIRSISERFGPIGGAALIYTVGSLFLVLLVGFPRLRTFPRRYLLSGSILFVAYEICLSLSLGFAANRGQAIELGIVNYLWPCFTVVLAILINGQRARAWVVPGIALSLCGIVWVVGGDGGISWQGIVANVSGNPLSYGLAFGGAIIWAVYCNVTKRYADGKNGVALFFMLTAAVLWIKYGMSAEPALAFDGAAVLELCVTGGAMAAGYALWNVGILNGNLTLLATASYFTPVLSTFFAALWLSTHLTAAFWQGVAMVTAGSLICWAATRGRPARGG
ncbi:aromatic amino acid DMT transporter YddG [Achromobacter pulmonis]|uniref:aromatic amino acid DMT transporter YddG n=1 Tax=Achromobacter pulmonis TaxID=1389932 RepID=UPI001468C563|nr:aromatic amino acid DMT transporter YddG [Achromobacter pulmonis]MCF7771439.1 aromatic amino acid DMT transporter YddG [Achromobacter pulmonis]CAB3695116.1 Aromatic amino acid exporter YddG [Achromobacter pulmonis]